MIQCQFIMLLYISVNTEETSQPEVSSTTNGADYATGNLCLSLKSYKYCFIFLCIRFFALSNYFWFLTNKIMLVLTLSHF